MKYFILTILLLMTILTVTLDAAEVTLAWDKVQDPIVTGYKLYAGTESRTYGQPVFVGDVSEYHLIDVPEGQNIFFAVTAHDAYGNESAYSEELPCFSVVLSKTGNGLVNPNTTTIDSLGMQQSFMFYPSQGYKISSIQVDGVYAGIPSAYTFFNITSNHTLSVNFSSVTQPPQDTYTITVSSTATKGAGGYILPATTTVNSGESQTFNFIVTKKGSIVSNVIVDGKSVGKPSSYTFTNITANHNISVVFSRK